MEANALPRRRLFGVLLIAFAIFSFGCSGDTRFEEIRGLAPSVPEDCVRQLLDSNDEAWTDYARRMGAGFLYEVNLRLGECIDTRTEEDFVRTRALVVPLMLRVTRFIQSERGDDDPFPTSYPTLVDTIAPAEAVRRRLLADDRARIMNDPDLPSADKAEQLLSFAANYDKQGMPGEAGWCRWRAADLIGASGDNDRRLKLLVRATGDYRRTDRYRNACQLFGVLGSAYEDAGLIDAMFATYAEGRQLADRLRLPHHAARIRLFTANYYRRSGRLAQAHDLYNEAQEVCREYGGGHYELRFVYEAMRFYADLGAWEIVERLLHRARALLRGATVDFLDHQDLQRVRIARVEARHAMATGDVDKGIATFEQHRDMARGLPWQWEHALYLLYWAEGLVDNGRSAQALVLLDEGAELAAEMDSPIYSARFAILRAEAESNTGAVAAAMQSIAAFDDFARGDEATLRTEWVTRDILLTRLLVSQGDREGAFGTLATGINRMRAMLGSMDASAHGYLWMGGCDGLRELLHDFTGGDPIIGYGVEQYWRECFAIMGSEHRGLDGGRASVLTAGTLMPTMRQSGERAAAAIDANDVHVTYATHDDHLYRWTNTGGDIQRAVVNATPLAIAELANESWQLMATDPGDVTAPPPAALAERLAQLAELLLPRGLDGTGPDDRKRFLVTTGGALARLPFETLNIGGVGDYVPLATRCDVAYLRRTEVRRPRPVANTGVILVNAHVSPSLRRRHPFDQPLEAVEREGRLVADRHPDARLLIDSAATKDALFAAWEGAPFVYIATHMLRDPEAPYYALIPLAAAPATGGTAAASADPYAASLDIADIRRHDFGAARIVVLSGCSSGVPFVGGGASGASLGDAFLDAGAGTVVQTFWDVRDDAAAELMAAFLARSGVSGKSSVTSLNDARRELIRGPNGARHPFHWAAYAINLGGL